MLQKIFHTQRLNFMSNSHQLWRAFRESGHVWFVWFDMWIFHCLRHQLNNYFWNHRTVFLFLFFWESALEEIWHVQFFPLQHKWLAWLPLWNHPTSLSHYKNTVGLEFKEKKKWLLSSQFSRASDVGIKTRGLFSDS